MASMNEALQNKVIKVVYDQKNDKINNMILDNSFKRGL